MALHFRCPCGTLLNAPDGSAGRGGECPVCKKIVVVPQESFLVSPSELAQGAHTATAAMARPSAVGELRLMPSVRTTPASVPAEPRAEPIAVASDDQGVSTRKSDVPKQPAQAPRLSPSKGVTAAQTPRPPSGPKLSPAKGIAAEQASRPPSAPRLSPARGVAAESSPAKPVRISPAKGVPAGSGGAVEAEAVPAAEPVPEGVPEPQEGGLAVGEMQRRAGRTGMVSAARARSTRRGVRTAPCPQCGESVIVGARKCPSCGVALSTGSLAKKLVVALVVLLALAGGGFAAILYLKPDLLPERVRSMFVKPSGRKPKAPAAVKQKAEPAPAPSGTSGGPAEAAPGDESGAARRAADESLSGMGLDLPTAPKLEGELPSAPSPSDTGEVQ